MSDENEQKRPIFVYFRDRAQELGYKEAYDAMDISKPFHGYDNPYKVSDLAVWQYIMANQEAS